MPTKQRAAKRIGQAERSSTMRAKLIAATRQSLMERGYARTTAVEVCARAGVTRGALFHHFSGLSALYAATLEETCAAMGARSREIAARDGAPQTLSAYIDSAWMIFGDPDFKIVIEAWLASRNDPELRAEIAPVIERIRLAASPEINPNLAKKVGRGKQDIAFYRLILEAMIGMALGRAVSPTGKAMGHEETVIALLKDVAHQREHTK